MSVRLQPNVFPVGTSVGAYPEAARNPDRAPSGVAVETEVVASDGSLTFLSLSAGGSWVAYAEVGGVHHYVGFGTSDQPSVIDLHVKNFAGVVGDLAHDDTAGLQAALNYLSPGMELQTGGGSYLFSSLTCPTDRIKLSGPGKFVSTMTNDGVTNAIWLTGNGVVVDGLTITTLNPILAYNHSNLNNGFLLILGNHALPAADTATVKNCTLSGAFTSNCEIRNARKAIVVNNRSSNAAGNGISATNCTDTVLIDGNQVDTCGDDMIVAVCDTTVPTGTQRLTITNNICDTGDAKGIATTGADRIVITGNHVRNTFTFGIAVFQDSAVTLGASHRAVISDNTLELCGYKFGAAPTNLHQVASTAPNGIYVGAGVQSAKVRGNIVSTTKGIGIHADYPTVTTTTSGSHAFPVGTITVGSTTGFPVAGIATVFATDGTSSTFSYTGKTSTTLTGVSGGFGTFASGSTVLQATVGLDISHNEVVGAGGAGIQAGNPDGTDWIRLLDTTISHNKVRQTVGGILFGSITGYSVLGNHVRSYKQGAAGSRRGILGGSLRNGVHDYNVVFNDDGGDEAILINQGGNATANKHAVDGGHNVANAPADA